MVVQDHHQSHICQYLYGIVEDLHCCFTDQFGVGFEVLLFYFFIVEEELQGVGQSDAIEMKFVLDVLGDLPQRSTLQAVNALPTQMSARPIPSRQFNSPSGSVDYICTFGGEGKGDFLCVKERFLFDELKSMLVVAFHEGLVFGHIYVPHFIDY